MLILAHYMAWYASKPVSGGWGWHWTMNRFDPEKTDAAGKREIASHDYPLIGPYDSGDPDALECHVLLMKLSGIDGVIIDWYGIDDYLDYGAIHKNALRLIEFVKKAGLRFAVCYEDQSMRQMVQGKFLPEADALARGQKTLDWLSKNWFSDRAYVRLEGRPILPVFGPQYFDRAQWAQLFAGMKTRPLLFGLPHLVEKSGADGAMGWPPVSGGKEIAPMVWRAYLSDLYARKGPILASVFPGFRDIYKEAGLHDSYGAIDARNGETFEETLRLAERSRAALIQLATWNDYGEGTAIEPTRSNGYRCLEALQKRRPRLRYRPDDLRLPVRLYELRKRLGPNSELTRASALLFAGKCAAARAALASKANP